MIYHMILNALAIIGLHLATGDEMILDKPARYLEVKLPYWMTKPLFNCPTCMASVWGTVYYIAFQPSNILHYPVYILGLAAIATFMTSLLPKDEPIQP